MKIFLMKITCYGYQKIDKRNDRLFNTMQEWFSSAPENLEKRGRKKLNVSTNK